ncbi:MAG TPA: putative toxin-antitoxin system toxin component, PIN family [Flavobacteriales bacterium]|nr:putative toxin-antitoxin system toxin component, PIN family [Flavobacteriales bacterium]HMR27554.1 putative toxin-antitoxin system toxin component, PIN family [Flavobacteriales bacterium]
MPARKRVRLVVDVNVLVSALVRGDGHFIRDVFNKQRFTVLVSPEFEREFADVVQRPSMRKYFTAQEAERAMVRVLGLTERLKNDPPLKAICRDPKDDYLLALAKAAKADLLVTGDDDLLVLKKHGKTRVIKPGTFRKEYM